MVLYFDGLYQNPMEGLLKQTAECYLRISNSLDLTEAHQFAFLLSSQVMLTQDHTTRTTSFFFFF